MKNFNLKKYLVENKLTKNSQLLNEDEIDNILKKPLYKLTPEEEKKFEEYLEDEDYLLDPDRKYTINWRDVWDSIPPGMQRSMLAQKISKQQRRGVIEYVATIINGKFIPQMTERELYNTVIKSAENAGIDRTIKYIENYAGKNQMGRMSDDTKVTKEDIEDKNTVLTFLQSIKEKKPIPYEDIADKLQDALKYSAEVIYFSKMKDAKTAFMGIDF